MSVEAWLTLAGIAVTVLTAMLGVVGGIFGYFWNRQQSANDAAILAIQEEQADLRERVARIEGRGTIPFAGGGTSA